MSQFFTIHPDNPQQRLIKQAAEVLRKGGVIAYPTDSGYALGCQLGDKQAAERIRSIRQFKESRHHMTLVCADLAEIATYAKVDNAAYRFLKSVTPGPFTVILPATREVPRRLMHPKRKTIGIRVPDNAICSALMAELGEPIMSASLILPNEEIPPGDAWEIRDTLDHALDLIIDGGYCGIEASTVLDLTDEPWTLIRQGVGDASAYIS
jgi:tRNA threonylcarbamoyl adenosine modification protein (Sua5/YciO/YrdC/YwlC family)